MSDVTSQPLDTNHNTVTVNTPSEGDVYSSTSEIDFGGRVDNAPQVVKMRVRAREVGESTIQREVTVPVVTENTMRVFSGTLDDPANGWVGSALDLEFIGLKADGTPVPIEGDNVEVTITQP